MESKKPLNENGFMRDIYHTTKSQFVDILFDAFAKVFVKAAMFMIVPCYPWHRLKGEKMSVKGEDDDSTHFCFLVQNLHSRLWQSVLLTTTQTRSTS